MKKRFKKEVVATSFQLPKDLYEKIRLEAFKKRVSISKYLREVLYIFFKEEEKKFE